MTDSFALLKARTATLVKALEEARAAQELEAKNIEFARLTAQHERTLDETVRRLKAEHKLDLEGQQSGLHRLQATLVQRKRTEMSITAALVEAQKRVAEVHDALTVALEPTQPGQGSVVDNDTSMGAVVTSVKNTENVTAPPAAPPGVPQGAQYMMTTRGLRYLEPSGDATAITLPSNIGIEVSYFAWCFLEK
jgi:phage-related tail protein